MKKLAALIFSAAIVPAMALGPAAFAETAEDSDNVNLQGANKEDAGAQSDRSAQSASGQHISAAPVGAFHAEDVIGQTVRFRGSGEEAGWIQDLIISEDGRVVGAVITTGSFLGLGGQAVGVNWDDLEQTMEDGESAFYTDMDAETLRNASEYQRE